MQRSQTQHILLDTQLCAHYSGAALIRQRAFSARKGETKDFGRNALQINLSFLSAW
jgi:hypothetical protein